MEQAAQGDGGAIDPGVRRRVDVALRDMASSHGSDGLMVELDDFRGFSCLFQRQEVGNSELHREMDITSKSQCDKKR